MSTIAIIGAGPGLGAAVARRFGREGFAVALVARDQAKLDALAGDLTAAGVTTRGYSADVRDGDALRRVLRNAADELGPVEVLQYSPIPSRDFLKPVLETTPADLAAAVEFSILGSFAAVDAVLPAMRAAGTGTIVFVNGGTSVRPLAAYAGTSVAFAGESAYAEILHTALAGSGVHATQLVIPGAITPDDPAKSPATIADVIWELHTKHTGFRHFLTPMSPPEPGNDPSSPEPSPTQAPSGPSIPDRPDPAHLEPRN
jgi:NADP-dependent 3-hydroxy acid dehydrogenase YdfG